jgi:hypothetical protein
MSICEKSGVDYEIAVSFHTVLTISLLRFSAEIYYVDIFRYLINSVCRMLQTFILNCQVVTEQTHFHRKNPTYKDTEESRMGYTFHVSDA